MADEEKKKTKNTNEKESREIDKKCFQIIDHEQAVYFLFHPL